MGQRAEWHVTGILSFFVTLTSTEPNRGSIQTWIRVTSEELARLHQKTFSLVGEKGTWKLTTVLAERDTPIPEVEAEHRTDIMPCRCAACCLPKTTYFHLSK
jgi:hypothetical protein